MSSKKHSKAAGQSPRGSFNKGRMQLTLYLWKKIGMLWKSYGISFLGICTNPAFRFPSELCTSGEGNCLFSVPEAMAKDIAIVTSTVTEIVRLLSAKG